MKSSAIDQAKIRRYLLGEVSEEEQQQVEEALLADDELIAELAMAEDELIDQYLAGELSGSEETSFRNHFLAAKGRRENLEFGRALRRYIEEHPETVRAAGPSRPHWWMSPKFAFALTVAAVVVAVWLAGDNQKLRRELSAQKEAARSVTAKPPQLALAQPVVLTLSPGLPRSLGQLPVIDKRPASDMVEIQLVLPVDAPVFQQYRATVSKVEGQSVWRQDELFRDGNSVKIFVPTSLLSRADWWVILSGVSAKGRTELSRYYFRVLFD